MRAIAILATTALVALAGCGGDDSDDEGSASTGTTATAANADRGYDGDGPVQVAQAYVDAFGSGDYAGACALIDAAALEKITQSGKFECTEVYEKGGTDVQTTQEQFDGATVTDSEITDDRGNVTVKIASGQEIQLPVVIEDGKWKVAS
ncbi:MAG: hypothetical protein ACJ762_11990 [Solirubrobacteraceae bacterium]